MGGHDPEKYGPIRSLIKHYAKKPHPFRTCVRDNRKRFGPRTERICAWIKDQIKGTTYWRGKEAAMVAHAREEGLTEAEIDQFILFSDDEPVGDPPTRDELIEYAEGIGVKFDPAGYDDPCPACNSWLDCNCRLTEAQMKEVTAKARMRALLRGVPVHDIGEHLEEAPRKPRGEQQAVTSPEYDRARERFDSALGDSDPSNDAGAIRDLQRADIRLGLVNEPTSGLAGDDRHPREIARAENGTRVYDDGSILDERTGLTRYPIHVFPDGSVRYDDNSTAKPGSLGALMVVAPMTREDRARLAAAGKGGLALKEFASVQELITAAVQQTYSDAGVGGAGELAADQVAQTQGVPGQLPGVGTGLNDANYAGIVGDATAKELQTRSAASAGRARAASPAGEDRYKPIKLRRGEKVVRGPQGDRGVWRQVDGNPIFIKIGQSPAQAAVEARANEGKRVRS